MKEILDRKQLAKKLNCCTETIKTYMCRSEFASVECFKIKRTIVYRGIEDKHLKLLSKFINAGKRRRFGSKND